MAELNINEINVEKYPDRRPSLIIKVQTGGESSRKSQARDNLDADFANTANKAVTPAVVV